MRLFFLGEIFREIHREPDMAMKMERKWAMPNKNTFDIPPITRLLQEEINNDEYWIDPFANGADLADCTNDLNPDFDTDCNIEAREFLKQFDNSSVDGVLYDPPYSPRQIKECYDGIGLGTHGRGNITQSDFWSKVEKEIARVVNPGGKVISFGWSSAPIGKTKGFKINRILLVAHGGRHNDTICTVEQKHAAKLNDFIDIVDEKSPSKP